MAESPIRLQLRTERRDEEFAKEDQPIGDFTFNAKVADVFDDMVSRSVPYYEEMQRMVCELAQDFAVPNTNLYDIGCSTATTLLTLDRMIDPNVTFIGIDNAPDMLEKAAQKIEHADARRPIDLKVVDLHQGLHMENASVVTMLLTLQFIRPLFRERVMKMIFSGLNDQGCLLLVEKLTSEDTAFNRLFI